MKATLFSAIVLVATLSGCSDAAKAKAEAEAAKAAQAKAEAELARVVAAQAPAAKGTRWEYCTLVSIWYVADNRLTVALSTPTQTIEPKSWKELGTRLGISAPQGSIAEVLNALGNQGWELVSHVEHESGGETRIRHTTWTFKRPK